MLTTRVFRPTLNAGAVYARAHGTATALQTIGGVSELTLDIEEDIIKQQDFSRAGGGTRAQVNRVKSVMMKAKLQDLNPINIARCVFGNTTAVLTSTVVDEPVVGFKGGLIKLAHINPTTVVLKKAAAVIAAAANYEVRPEGLFILDTAPGILDADALTVSYAFNGYDVIEALTQAAPTLEMFYAGINEAGTGDASTVDLFRVRTGAMKSWALVNSEFAEIEMEGEVLLDPSKTGAGLSKFFKVRMA